MKNKDITKVLNCRICGLSGLEDFLFLGDLSVPNGFLKKKELAKKEKKYPLTVSFCKSCSLVQLRYIVDPNVMFRNYLYIPSSSKTRIEHFKKLASQVTLFCNLNDSSLVVDIGSNDGSLLTCFKNLGTRVLGVDSAENLVKIASLNGIDTIQGYFNKSVVKKIVNEKRKASAVLATNVVAHISSLNDFLKDIDILLLDSGIFVCEFPYVLDLIMNNQFDTIYHEHLSYFSLRALFKWSESSPLDVFKVERDDLDGGSIKLFWKKKKNKKIEVDRINLQKMLDNEKKFGLYDVKTYKNFSLRIKALKRTLIDKLQEIKKKGKSIVGYGAAAKGNIMLNHFGIGHSFIDYIVDSTPYKQGLYTPGTHIPIFDEEKILETKPDYILILAWNFKDEIMEKNKEFKKFGGKFIVTVPKLQIL